MIFYALLFLFIFRILLHTISFIDQNLGKVGSLCFNWIFDLIIAFLLMIGYLISNNFITQNLSWIGFLLTLILIYIGIPYLSILVLTLILKIVGKYTENR